MKIPTIKTYRFLSKGMFQATKEMKASFVNKPRQAALSKRIKARGFKFKHRNTPKFTSIFSWKYRFIIYSNHTWIMII